jgi:hypothetical protein
MDQAVQSRVYPASRRPAFWKEQLRFWRSLISACVLRKGRLRSVLLLSSPSFVRALAWRHYVDPRAQYRPVPLSDLAQGYLAQLRQQGIVSVDRSFADLADYIRDRYFAAEYELAPDSPLRANGLIVSRPVSFSDQRLHEVLFDPEICAIVCNYYGRQAYYRDNPTVHKEHAAASSRPLISGVFHSDSYRQISFMLLLSDLTEHDTHMEFASGSHDARQPSYDRTQIDQDAVTREFKIVHVVGKKGTLFLFDTEGLHRGSYHQNTGREIFHVNMTTGTWPFTDDRYDRLETIFPDPQTVPEHVRNFVAGAVK